MGITKKCSISKYDESIKEPPFLTMKIDETVLNKPENDYLGEKFAAILRNKCKEMDYKFRFYSLSQDKEYDYDIVVN